MKAKISLLVVKQDSKRNFLDPERLSILVDANGNIPFKYVGSKNEEETIRDLCDEYLSFRYEWLMKRLVGFRKSGDNEVEATYLTIVPAMQGSWKKGRFIKFSSETGEDTIDGYYEQLSSKFGSSRVSS